MPIRTQNNGPTTSLSSANEPGYIAQRNRPLKDTPYASLIAVIAETFDAAASGKNAWLSIGKNRQGDAFLLTYHEGTDVAYAGGLSLVELSEQCADLLSAP